MAKAKQEAQMTLMEGLSINWKTESKVESYYKRLAKKVMTFEEAVSEVIEKTNQIEEYLKELSLCEVSRE